MKLKVNFTMDHLFLVMTIMGNCLGEIGSFLNPCNVDKKFSVYTNKYASDLYCLFSTCSRFRNETKNMKKMTSFFKTDTIVRSAIVNDHYEQFVLLAKKYKEGKIPKDMFFVAANCSCKCLEYINTTLNISRFFHRMTVAACAGYNVESFKYLEQHFSIERISIFDSILVMLDHPTRRSELVGKVLPSVDSTYEQKMAMVEYLVQKGYFYPSEGARHSCPQLSWLCYSAEGILLADLLCKCGVFKPYQLTDQIAESDFSDDQTCNLLEYAYANLFDFSDDICQHLINLQKYNSLEFVIINGKSIFDAVGTALDLGDIHCIDVLSKKGFPTKSAVEEYMGLADVETNEWLNKLKVIV